jgi:DNA-binding MarR family transcriptional regulator
MKVHRNADGTMDFDVQNSSDVELLRKLVQTNGEKPKTAPDLTDKQYAVWNYLVENDVEGGVHINAIARELDVTVGNVGQRLSILIERGYAYRVGTGRYRAKC